MVKQDRVLSQNKAININSLYDNYAGMLLGYIFEVVKDRSIAEEYLVKIFCKIAKTQNDKTRDEINTWCQLQRLAKTELTPFYNASEECEAPDAHDVVKHRSSNKYLEQMTDEQQQIFCNFYYNKKSTAQLSSQLNISEDLIRKSLKESFAIIRRAHDN